MTETLVGVWTTGLLLSAALLPQAKVAWKFWRFTIFLCLAAATAMTLLTFGLPAGATTRVAFVAAVVSLAGCGVWLGLLLVTSGKPLAASTAAAPAFVFVSSAAATIFVARHASIFADHAILAPAAMLASAAVVGTATMAAMLGHAYLTATEMPIDPLRRAVGAYAVVVALHSLIGSVVCWRFFASYADAGLGGVFWIAVAVMYALIGLAAPPAFAIMAWQAVKVRNTQSTTGIMYFGMVLNFIGALALCFLLRGR